MLVDTSPGTQGIHLVIFGPKKMVPQNFCMFQDIKIEPGEMMKDMLVRHKKIILVSKRKLVGGFNPFEKYARQIGSFPQFSG